MMDRKNWGEGQDKQSCDLMNNIFHVTMSEQPIGLTKMLMAIKDGIQYLNETS